MSELLSIIVPFYNSDKYLDECISSIIYQTYKNFELILVNDGSTDTSLEICNKFKENDNRIIVVDKENTGVSDSRNIGLSLAKGKYIGFVDSDDFIEKEMYQSLIEKIQSEKSEICVMDSYTIRLSKTKNLNNISPIDNAEALKKLLLLEFPTSVWAYLYTKKSLDGIKFSQKIHFFEDLEFNYRVLCNIQNVSVHKSKLYNYRISETSINSQSINYKKLTCLDLLDSIIENIKSKQIALEKQSRYFVSHCLISMILSISKIEETNNEFYSILRKYCIKYMNSILFSKYVPLKHKLIIFMYQIHPKAVTKSIFFIKYRNK